MLIVFSPSEGFSEKVSNMSSAFPVPIAPADRSPGLGKSVKPILLPIHLSPRRLMVPRVLPAHQYRTCTDVSVSLYGIEVEVGFLVPGVWSLRTVLLCAVHQLRLSVSSCSSLNWAQWTRAYEEPHAGAQACRAEAVEWRHMWPKVARKALGWLRGHCRESIDLSMGGKLAV